MTLTSILLFAAAILLYRLLFRGRERVWVLLVASALAIYWLQPGMPVRNLDFWLPTLTLGLTVLSWAVSSSPQEHSWKSNWPAALVLVGVVLAVGLTRYISQTGLITATRPPQTYLVLIVLAVISALAWALYRFPRTTRTGLAVLIGLLLVVLVVLKTPALSQYASVLWRSVVEQNPDLASALDIRWLGFSYVAFRLVHTLRDRQTGRLPAVSLQEYVVNVIFFPAFTAGPIDRLERFTKDLRKPLDERTPWEEVLGGGQRLVTGLFKKFVLADLLALVSLSSGGVLQTQSAGWLWLMTLAYAFQIYFDFSGYTDIAIGLGKWLGFQLPENFNHPYLKSSLTTFWNNWHMTLTQWFRAYYFNPLTRAIRSAKKPWPGWTSVLFLQVSTMVLIGLWHGVTAGFVVWGLWHGIGLFINNRWTEWFRPSMAKLDERPQLKRTYSVLATLLTFVYVSLGWVWFAVPQVGQAAQVLLRLFGG